MSFYDLTKSQRDQKYIEIQNDMANDLRADKHSTIAAYFDDSDTYIRKAAYLGIGRIYKSAPESLDRIINVLKLFAKSDSERIRQTVINAAGEIAVSDFSCVEDFFDVGITDPHHMVRNAVQGSLKKSGKKNPTQIIPFCRRHICDSDPEVRRTAAHGLELRGRTHPEDIMPTLRLMQFETHKRVRPMLIHIFGQISYKKGCLEKVTAELLTWEDKALADECFAEIIKQHHHINNHFQTVETLSPLECEKYLRNARSGERSV